MRADLHIHTTASDGCWSPEEVVAHVCAAAVGMFAIADHDTLANVQHTADLARQAGLAFIPAAEVSAVADGAGIHVLAYGVDPTDLALNRMLEEELVILEESDEGETFVKFPRDRVTAYHIVERIRSRLKGGEQAEPLFEELLSLGEQHDVFADLTAPIVRMLQSDQANLAIV